MLNWVATDQIDATNPYCPKAQYAVISLVCIGVICYILLFGVTVSYFWNYKFRNKWMLLFFIMLNIAVILRVIFFTTTYLSFKKDWRPLKRCLFGFLIFIGNLFFGCGVVFSVFNWLHLQMILNQYTSYIKEQIKLRRLWIYWWISIFLVCFCFIGDYALTCNANDDNYNKIDKITRWVRAIVFLILSIAVIIVGYKLDRKFK